MKRKGSVHLDVLETEVLRTRNHLNAIMNDAREVIRDAIMNDAVKPKLYKREGLTSGLTDVYGCIKYQKDRGVLYVVTPTSVRGLRKDKG